MAENVTVGLGVVALSILILGYVAYNIRRYRKIDEAYPERSLDRVSPGESPAVRGCITEHSPTTAAPFNDRPSALSLWAIEKSDPGTKPNEDNQKGWITCLRGHERPDSLELDTADGPVTVELTDPTEPVEAYVNLPPVPYDDWELVVEREEDTSQDIVRFLETVADRCEAELDKHSEGWDLRAVIDAVRDGSRYFRYSEKWLVKRRPQQHYWGEVSVLVLRSLTGWESPFTLSTVASPAVCFSHSNCSCCKFSVSHRHWERLLGRGRLGALLFAVWAIVWRGSPFLDRSRLVELLVYHLVYGLGLGFWIRMTWLT